MDHANPYKPPEAQLGAVAIGSEAELVAAVAPFVASRRDLRILALLATLGALVSVVGGVATGEMPEPGVALMLVLIGGAYLVAATLLFRLASAVKTLAKAPTLADVAAVLERMAQTWVVGLGALVLMSAAGWAHRFAAAAAIMPTLWEPGPRDAVMSAAAKLRRVLVVVVVGTAALMLIGIAGSFVMPPASAAMAASMVLTMTLVGAAVQLALLWLVWRQIPALDDFIAQPNGATLRAVASAHALIWRVMVVGIFLVAFLGVAAAVVLPILFRR